MKTNTIKAKKAEPTAATLTDTGNAAPTGAQLNGVNFDEWNKLVQEAKTIPAKRIVLKELSQIVKPLVDADIFGTVNEAVVSLFYERGEHTAFHTYKDWLNLGYHVKRGVTAFPVWGRPKSEQLKDEGKELADGEHDFHPVALIFSNMQVYKLQDKE